MQSDDIQRCSKFFVRINHICRDLHWRDRNRPGVQLEITLLDSSTPARQAELALAPSVYPNAFSACFCLRSICALKYTAAVQRCAHRLSPTGFIESARG